MSITLRASQVRYFQPASIYLLSEEILGHHESMIYCQEFRDKLRFWSCFHVLEEAMEFSNLIAARTVSFMGAQPSLGTMEQVIAFHREAGRDTKILDAVLLADVVPSGEGGPLNRAPRNSILAETLILQMLSVILQADAHVTPEQYVRHHPHGALGRLREVEKHLIKPYNN